MKRLAIIIIFAALALAGPLSASAWVAAGPRGVAAGGGWNHGAYYRPPVVVHGGYNSGYSGGQVAAAGIAGLAVGAMAGAAVASAHSAPPPPAAPQTPAYPSQMPVGTQVTVLPGTCGSATVRNVEYYQCGPNWYKPYFGNASVYYQVVSPPN